MKGIQAQSNVALMAQQFQNLARLGHEVPPPPPQSQPPTDDPIESLNGPHLGSTGASALARTHLNGHTHRAQLYKHQHYNPSEHLNQLAFYQQQSPTVEPLSQLDLGPNVADQLRMPASLDDLTGDNLPGMSRLLDDLQRAMEDHETADIVFLVGSNEAPVSAHRVILRAR